MVFGTLLAVLVETSIAYPHSASSRQTFPCETFFTIGCFRSSSEQFRHSFDLAERPNESMTTRDKHVSIRQPRDPQRESMASHRDQKIGLPPTEACAQVP